MKWPKPIPIRLQLWKRYLVVVMICHALTPFILRAQETPVSDANQVQKSVASLESLLKSIKSKEQEIAKLQNKLQNAAEEVTREEIIQSLRKSKEEEAVLESQFEKFATSVDVSAFAAEKVEKPFDWQEELGSLLKPIMDEMERATADARTSGELRTQIEELETLAILTADATAHLEKLIAVETSPDLRERLRRELETWTQRRNDTQNQVKALQLQLENRLAQRKSFLETTSAFMRSFFRNRGRSLLLGVLAFCAIFFLFRLIALVYRRVTPRQQRRRFAGRLILLLTQIASVVGGLLAATLVFNLMGDWFLLGLVVIFLLGLGWAGIKTLPQHIEIIKLLLNIGAVKESERLVYDDIPWRVATLSFTSVLVNPLLDGGKQKLPVRDLVGCHSRPNGDKEEWFPCRADDWVELADGRIGRVAYQAPSCVQIVEPGGSQVVYQTGDFLSLNPKNLTTGFRIDTSFGVDYKHQAECTTQIPTAMQRALEQDLPKVVDKELIQSIQVEFASAAASSLDMQILVDMDGAAAAQLPKLKRAVSRILVEACNINKWEIPFEQLTIHQS